MKFNINDYQDNYVMHCKTEEEANDFCKYLDSVGRKWRGDRSYLNRTQYHRCGEHTAYDFNKGEFAEDFWYRNRGFTVLEWSDFMGQEFTKSDLKTGDVVKFKDGTIGIVNYELGTVIRKNDWYDLDYMREDLTDKKESTFDIVAVRRPQSKDDCHFNAFTDNWGTLVYERKEPKSEEMTLAEVCKLLGKEIKIIK